MKRALLIGASRYKRVGVPADLDRMQGVLEDYGFKRIVRCPRHSSCKATREVIRSALDSFADEARAGDIVAIYYTGHGGLARFSGQVAGRAGARRVWRYLVPEGNELAIDEGRFSGILDVELGHFVERRLVAKGCNVTLILECCYAGEMLVPSESERRHRAMLIEDEVGNFEVPEWLTGPQPWSSSRPQRLASANQPGPAPVIVAATSGGRKSYEGRQGLFTEALATALLRHRHHSISWGRLIDEVRRAVQTKRGQLNQEPHVIGPRGREVFGTTTADVSREFEVLVGREGRLRLFAGKLHALREGDTIELLQPSDGTSLGLATVREPGPARSMLELEHPQLRFDTGRSLVGVLRAQANKTPVRLLGESPTMSELRAAVRDSPWLREDDSGDSSTLEVGVEQGRLRVAGPGISRRPVPEQAREDLASDPASPVPWVLADLESLARARGFVDACEGADSPPEAIEFWLRAHGESGPRELGFEGNCVVLGERVEVGMRNRGGLAGEFVFVNLLNLGVEGHLHSIHANVYTRNGVDLWSEWSDDARGQVRSAKPWWPSEVPACEPARDTFFFVVTSESVDLESLTKHGPSSKTAFAPRPTAARDIGVIDKLFEPVQLYVKRIDFVLDPTATDPATTLAT